MEADSNDSYLMRNRFVDVDDSAYRYNKTKTKQKIINKNKRD